VENEIAYRNLFDRFAEPGDEFGEEWIETFEEHIIEEREVVATHSWERSPCCATRPPLAGLRPGSSSSGRLPRR
jgi:hypothetical protein